VFFRRYIDGAKIKQISVGIEAVDFEDFGNEPSPRPAFDLDNDVQRIADVRLDGAIRKFHAALQNAARETSEALLRGTRMDGGKRTGVARIQKLEEIECFPAPDFAELRGEYICSWCEMRGGYLSAIPHPNSKCEVRRFSYPRDAEIVGRVIGVTMRLVEAH